MVDDTPITAYHGSPHDFEQFDTSKIGTGEGAQAYGHGLYFAESEPIAQHYKNALSSNKFRYENVQPDEEAKKKFAPYFANIQNKKSNLVDKDGFINLDENSGNLESIATEEEKLRNMMVMDTINRNPHIQYGRMYEVAINAHPDHFLDWDKSLSEQSEHVRNAFDFHKDLIHSNPYLKTFFNNMSEGHSTGAQIYKELSDKNAVGLGDKGTSDFLHSMGIHGIKYLDANSRVASDKPTHNYVVFDHNRVNVKRKYEQGGTVSPKAIAKTTQTIHNSPIVGHALGKVSAALPALDPSLMAAKAGRRS